MIQPQQIDYPTPDPSWDYSSLWAQLQGSKKEIEYLLRYLSTLE